MAGGDVERGVHLVRELAVLPGLAQRRLPLLREVLPLRLALLRRQLFQPEAGPAGMSKKEGGDKK